MKNIEEAISHCLEVAEEQERRAKLFERPNPSVKGSGRKYNSCLECASEHRQLAEWLRELQVKRQIIISIKEQCKAWKRNDFQNRDYGIGFISALSNIEGLIAYTEEQTEVKADDSM